MTLTFQKVVDANINYNGSEGRSTAEVNPLYASKYKT